VIEQFDLTRALATHGRPLSFLETKDRLAESIEVRGIPDTNLLEVSVYLRNPQLASDITNAIVENYSESRVKYLRKKIDDALAQLDFEIERGSIPTSDPYGSSADMDAPQTSMHPGFDRRCCTDRREHCRGNHPRCESSITDLPAPSRTGKPRTRHDDLRLLIRT
jgi:hypothetical protein